jgi:hypothetical protein
MTEQISEKSEELDPKLAYVISDTAKLLVKLVRPERKDHLKSVTTILFD